MYARIHHAAYVDSLTPRYGSYFARAMIRPMLPSWMRSLMFVRAPVLVGDLHDEPQVGGDEQGARARVFSLLRQDGEIVLALAAYGR